MGGNFYKDSLGNYLLKPRKVSVSNYLTTEEYLIELDSIIMSDKKNNGGTASTSTNGVEKKEDATKSASAKPRASRTRKPATSVVSTPVGGDEKKEVLCRCGKMAVFLQIKKDGPRKGKYFYTCPNMDQASKCSFFAMQDDVMSKPSDYQFVVHSTPSTLDLDNSLAEIRGGLYGAQSDVRVLQAQVKRMQENIKKLLEVKAGGTANGKTSYIHKPQYGKALGTTAAGRRRKSIKKINNAPYDEEEAMSGHQPERYFDLEAAEEEDGEEEEDGGDEDADENGNLDGFVVDGDEEE